MTSTQKISSFTNLVKEMREAQIQYFKTKDVTALRIARDFEHRVDKALAEIYESVQQQGRLM